MTKKNKDYLNNKLKTRWGDTKKNFTGSALKDVNPVVKDSYIWAIVCYQLKELLGTEVHGQWFKPLRPLVLSDNVLVLEATNHFAAQWVHHHYQELIDTLLCVHDKNLSCFVLCQSDLTNSVQGFHFSGSLKSSAPKINS